MTNEVFKTADIVLSQEEVAWLFRHLGTAVPAGMKDPLEEIEETSRQFLLDAAQRALLARNLVFYNDDNQLQVDRGLWAIASIIIDPEQVVVVAGQKNGDDIVQHYFYRVPEMIVSYRLLSPGLYEFDVTTDVDMGKSLVSEWLTPYTVQTKETPVYSLSTDILLQAQQIAGTDSETAVSHLTLAGVSIDDAKAFVKALSDPQFNLVLQLIDKPGKQSKQKLLVLTTGINGHWIVNSSGRQDEQVELQCLSTDQAIKTINISYDLVIDDSI